MKKILILTLSLVLFYNCSNNKQENSDTVIIDIKANNLPTQKAYISNSLGDNYPIKSYGNGVFKDTLKLQKGFYTINIGNEYSNIFLKPGYNLAITLDGKKFDETIAYTGNNADNNNYLAEELLLKSKLFNSQTVPKYVSLNEKDFLNKLDSIEKVLVDNLNSKKLKDKEFVDFEKKKYLIWKKEFQLAYPVYNKMMTKVDKVELSDTYPKPLQNIDLKDKSWLYIPGFVYLVNDYLDTKTKDIKNDISLEKLKIIENDFNDNPELQQALVKTNAKQGISFTTKLEDYYALCNKLITDDKFKEEIKKIYNNLKDLQPGNKSVDFTAYDINGKEYHLKDFAGKLLYIDLWATWCGPCKMEIPHLEKIKEKYKDKNITFLSISVWDKKEKWEEEVKSGKIKGWQLISTDREMNFLKKYVVQGIPRFILLDEKGLIISHDAPRPSNPELVNLIDGHLNGKN